MRLRLFRAAGMAEAMAQLRAALGPDAVILDSRRIPGGGVEVTAALDRDPAPPEQPAAEPPGAPEADELWLIPPRPPARPLPDPPTSPAPAPRWRRHNLPRALAARLGPAPLAEGLAAALGFAPLPDGLDRPVLLAGPPGAGKTLSCAKLATRGVLAGAAPLVVTTDNARAGAPEQLAAFTRLLGLTLAVAPEPTVLARAMARRQPGQPTWIDTAGCDPFDAAQASRLRALAQAAEAAIVVVLPAGLDPDEAGEMAAAFVALGARHLLPTRLDGARRLGGVLAAAAAGLALAEAGTGPGAADGLTPIDATWLARRLQSPFAAEPLA
ncbi:GTPase [Paeniroseomonas aquatica]|uniref:GTPase n=1 Tax=Paeniroseomonas aquatica TaxID=373043 RepID=A0ABT8A9G1_9PROT|nr:GTPase [Paeniroseomonas aquatica]MDN3566344.1 GTPase [Paeniroseomonas aquatica]